MVYFFFFFVVILLDGDISNELLLCIYLVVFFIGDDRCINYFFKFIFCDFEWGGYICLGLFVCLLMCFFV